MANRLKMIICAPFSTLSGYGERSRDLIKSIMDMDRYDLQLISTRWGNTPMSALSPDNPVHLSMLDSIRTEPLNEKPDIWMQVTVPNEFQPVGKYNIGVTAGIETTACSGEWLEGLNRMDLIIVSSNHAKEVFESSAYQKIDSATHKPIGEIRCTKPIVVLNEGIDLSKFFPIKEKVSLQQIDDIPEDFCFLFVGHWLNGDFTHDRKDVGGLIHTFLGSFAGERERPALIVKTGGNYSYPEREMFLERIHRIKESFNRADLPNVYLLHGELESEDLNRLYNHDKIKCFVSFTKGEGFGRPIAEFASTGKPILVPNWSGQKDFINTAFHKTLSGELRDIHQSAVWENVLIPQSKWFYVDYPAAAKSMQDMVKQYKTNLYDAKKASQELRSSHSYEKMKSKLSSFFDEYIPKNPVLMTLNIPSIQKIG